MQNVRFICLFALLALAIVGNGQSADVIQNYIDTYKDILERIENTIQFRRKELKAGTIEVGENIPTSDLEIFSKSEDSYIIPKKEKDTKCRSEYNDYVTFIDTE